MVEHFARIKIGEFGAQEWDLNYEGGIGEKKLIQIFVEAYYVFFGRPNAKTLQAIMDYTHELDEQKAVARKRLGFKD